MFDALSRDQRYFIIIFSALLHKCKSASLIYVIAGYIPYEDDPGM
jgi:hypothetical protein